MAKRLTHKRTTYYLPSWQGGDVVMPVCQRGKVGWSGLDIRLFRMAETGIDCPSCRWIMAFGFRPSSMRKDDPFRQGSASRVARLSVPRVSTLPGISS